jgi:hypothetical protein
MINTDPLSLIFFMCFLVGLVYFIATALLGNLGHGAGHANAHTIHAGVSHAGSHSGVHMTSRSVFPAISAARTRSNSW